MVQIVPSILSADFARLGEEIAAIERGGAKMLHVDIMDGHFVPNLTMGPPVVKSIRKITGLTLDLHLMIEDPDFFAPAFIEAGADQVLVHQEVCRNLDRTLRMIRSEGARAGVALNPATPIAMLEDVLDIVDYVLIMSVNPGFGGQEFIPRSLEKIRQLARIRDQRRLDFAIEIDGGVSRGNVTEIVRAGCDWLVAGSSVFHSADPAATVKEMQQLAAEANAVRV
ncbi:MAG: ribulose-phosphate 3-epimerase [Acidobacteriota bacterium]|nr:ribulose-phosphate 3-epimerase [Acidobacteriota bacterium]